MTNWLFMFRPETYENVKEHGTVGVRKQARKAFGRVRQGDRFVTYVSQVKLFDGYGRVTSDVFEDEENIFLDDPPQPLADLYHHRCRVDFDKTDAALDAGVTLWGLTPFEDLDRTTPANMIYCKGGFIEIPDSDFEALRAWLDGKRTLPWPREPEGKS